MDSSSLLMTLAVIAYFGVTMYVANTDDVAGKPFGLAKWFLYGAIGMMFTFGLVIGQFAIISTLDLPAELVETSEIPVVDGFAAFVIFVICSLAAWWGVRLIGVPESRETLKRLSGRDGTFNPESTVHTTAFVLSTVLLCVNLGNLVLGGGLEGLAESYAQDNNFVSSAILQQALWLFAAFLGIGLFIRRDAQSAFRRLGLRLPTGDDIFPGVGLGLLMVIFVLVLGVVWSLFTPAETLESQSAASEQIANALSTIHVALVISLLVSIGEETFFRGALQPVFGIGLTSVFFALMHIQYTLTPASLAVFILALGVGWLRRRHSTTASIIAHFTYNFAQLALVILVGSVLGGATG